LGFLEKAKIRITKVEERTKDSWVDMSLRSMREGGVRFYNVNDPLTGKWLFKVCSDDEMSRTTVKALKCPPGKGFAQLEGSTVLYQKSLVEGYYYGVLSLSYIDESERLRRNVVNSMEEVPDVIKNNFKTAAYEEARGKTAIGKNLVVLCEEKDEKKMITLFILQRAWPISKIPPTIGTRKPDLLDLIRSLEQANISDVFQKAEERHGLAKEDTDVLLKVLESEGKIVRSDEYIKTRS